MVSTQMPIDAAVIKSDGILATFQKGEEDLRKCGETVRKDLKARN